MTFEELKNGMKDLFSSLGAKTSDSNYAVGLFDKISAEPKGIMDMASLASVLGGMKPAHLPDNSNMDTILTTGLYYNTSDTIVNGGNKMGIWVVFSAKLSNTIYSVFQIAIDTRGKGTSPIKYRVGWTDDGNGWSNWKAFATT